MKKIVLLIKKLGRINSSLSFVSFYLFYKNIRTFCVLLIAFLLIGYVANAQYSNVPVTGFNADVVADGVGSAASSSTSADVDGAGWVFVTTTFDPGSGVCASSTTGLPANNQISSLTTPGLIYNLQPYTSNNALRIPNPGTGTLTLTTPVKAANLYLLALGGSGTCTVTATVKFTDSTSQDITGTVNDWCSGSSPATAQFYRIQRSSITCNGGNCQYLYDFNLAIDPTNYSKQVAYIKLQNTNGVLNVMGVGMKPPCVGPTAQPAGLSASAITTSSITGTFTAASPDPAGGYLVVRYPQGTSTITPPAVATTYTPGQLLGLGKVVQASNSTTFVAIGLTPNTSYDFYVYSYNGPCGPASSSPNYLTTSPLVATLTTDVCTGSMSGVIPVGPGLPNNPGGGYTSLTNALADININGIASNTILELQPNYDGTFTNETFPIIFPTNPCINASQTLTVRPASGISSPLIIKSGAAVTIDMNGASYVTIDGRPGGFGTTSQLTIMDTTASGVAIRFMNDAHNNTITYCDVQGQNTTATASATPSGIVYFGSANSTVLEGNDYNTISYCNIHSTSIGYSAIGICSFGSTTSSSSWNDHNTISNCNIYDYFNAGVINTGILISSANTDWTIDANSFYQTSSRTYTTGNIHSAININNTSGNNFTITNNYIGGSASNAGSTPWTLSGTIATRFIGINLAVGATAASSVQGNTIANISLTSSSGATTAPGVFCGIYTTAGNSNIGTVTGNTIGSGTGTGSIAVTSSTSGGISIGIACASTGTINASNNSIGSLTLSGSTASISHGFWGISSTSATTSLTVSGNTIGSTSTANSINCATASTSGTLGAIRVIHITSGTSNLVSNNTIANINHNYNPTTASTSNIVLGINVTSGSNTVTGNTIYNMTSSANATGTLSTASVIGILNTSTTAGQTVSQNTVYALSNSHATAATSVVGIHISSATSGTNTVARNLVYNLAVSSSSASASVLGINASAGLFNYQNNMIRLGYIADGSADITNPVSIIGFNEISGTSGSGYYFNSIYIGGTVSTAGSTNTFAFKSAVTTNSRTIQNNILFNARSNGTGTGKHYAITVGGTAANPTGLVCNYNDMFANGTGGFLGLFNNTDQATLANWQTSTGQGAASMSIDPVFSGAALSTPDLHITGTTAIESAGFPISFITDDFDGNVRSGLTPTDIGAHAGNFSANDISAPVISNLTALTATCSTSNQVLTATITDASGVPSSTNEPRLYFKRVSPSATAYFSTAGTLSSGTTSNGVWSFTIDYSLLGGVAIGDSFSYYIVAQDVASNITANPVAGFSATNVNSIVSPPTTPLAYIIHYSLGGSYNVGSGNTFPTLTSAIAAYNTACLTGPVTYVLTDNNYSTAETFPIIISNNANATATNTLTIIPSLTNTVINTGTGSQTFNLNGARYVTFEGRIGAVGSTPNLTIQNGLSSGNAIQFINDAQNNTINYCTVLATNTSASSGMIVFGPTTFTTATSGNSNNTISNCRIDGGAGVTASPTTSASANAIYSSGTSTYVNKNNTISNNLILDYFQASGISNGIYINSNSTDWIISSNKFYQTNARTQTTSGLHTGINISGSGNNYQITNNTIGYASSTGTGVYTLTSSVGTTFRGISLTVGTTTATSVQGNTIDGISLTTTASGTSSSSPFMGIYVSSGLTTIGDVTGNNIGNQSNTGTFSYSTNSSSTSDVHGIFNFGSSNWTVKNNSIGGITAANTNATPAASNIFAVRVNTGSSVSFICQDNIVGGTVANSIQSTSAATGSIVNGILNNNPIGTINGNTVRNLSTVDGTGTGLSSSVSGIASSSSAAQSIYSNTIYNLSSSGASATISGITFSSGSTVNIYSNTIYAISGSGTTTPVANGIQVSGGTTYNIYKNRIYSLSQSGTVTSVPAVNGVSITAGTTVNTYNNLIGDLQASNASSIDAIRAISVTSTSTSSTYRVYFNSIYINASSIGTNFGTTGIYHTASSTSTTAALDLRNNIIVDLSVPSGTGIIASLRRSGTSLNNYATTSNRNLFYAGTASANNLIMYDGTNSYQTIGAFQGAAIRDLNSFSAEPGFTYSTAGSFFQSVTPSAGTFLNPVAGITTQCESGAIAISTPNITDDFGGNTRSATPDLGAWEFVGITPTPSVTFDSISPGNTSKCVATDRIVYVKATTPAGSITSVTLNYQYNAVLQTPIAMSNTSGNIWEGTIPAPISPANAVVGWSVTATNSSGVSNTYASSSTYTDEPLYPIVVTASASKSTICSGSATNLSVSLTGGSPTVTSYSWSDGTTTVGTTNPLSVSPTANTVYTCTITASGCTKVSSFDTITVNALPASPTANPSTQCGVGIPLVSVTSVSGNVSPSFNWYDASTGGNLLQGPPFGPLASYYTNDFTSASLTNSSVSDNASITGGVCQLTPNSTSQLGGLTINSAGYNSDQYQIEFDLTTSGSGLGNMADGLSYSFANDASAALTAINAENGTGTKLKIGFVAYTNGTSTNGIYLMYNCIIDEQSPSTAGVLAYSTNTSWVNSTGNHVTITINTSGQLTMTLGSTTIFNNVQLPSAYLSADKSTWKHVFKARTGGISMLSSIDNINIQASQPAAGLTTYSNSINTTTTFYVSEYSGGCESARTTATATVNIPDAIVASASATSNLCVNTPVSLSVSQTGTTNSYVLDWTALPTTASGITGSASGSLFTTTDVTPTAKGVYTYTVTGTESSTGCITSDTVNVSVIDPFSGGTPSVSASANPACSGSTVSLTVNASAMPLNEPFETSSFPLTTFAASAATGTVSATQNTTYYSQGASSILLNTPSTNADVSISTTSNIDLTAFSSAQLTFSHIAVMEGPTTSYDYGRVEYSTDGGSSWIAFPTSSYAGAGTLFNGNVSFSTRSYSNWISAFTGTGSTPTNSLWQNETINIPSTALTSTQFRLRFRYTTDISTNYYGWLIDNVKIINTPAISLYSWSDGSSIIGATDTLFVNPTSATTYDCTVTSLGCTATTSTTTITVNAVPSDPIASNSSQCGTIVPTASVTSTSGASNPIFNWYAASTGGTALQSSTSATYTSTVSSTTTFYVSEMSGGCESGRTPVTATVTVPDALTASSSATSNVCANSTISLSVSQTGSTNSYTLDWTASTATGSGIPTTASGSLSSTTDITPTAAGLYTYTITGTETSTGCITTSTVDVTVVNPFSSLTVTSGASINPVCSGASTDLSVSIAGGTPTITAYSWSDGTTVVGTTNPLSVSPTTNTTYTCTVTTSGCSASSSSTSVTVNALPTAPSATTSTQCGIGIPTASVTSTSGSPSPSFNWYNASTAGNLLQGPPFGPLATYYSNDFTSAALTNSSISGNSSITGGQLILQPNLTSQQGAILVNASGYNADQYKIEFDMTTSGPNPMADGFSYSFGDDVNPTATSPSAEHGTGSKLKIGFFTYNAASGSDGRGIYLMYNCTATSGYTAATTGVLAYSTNTSFINATQHITATINTLGQLTVVVGTTTVFTNVQLPAAFLTSDKSTWKHVVSSRSGGVSGSFVLDNLSIESSQPAPGSTTYLKSINTTTTFYVSELSGGCESSRTAVTATVNNPDALTASASSTSNVCANTSVSLSVSQTGSTNSYTLDWTASPAATSGISTSLSGSLVSPTSVTPTAKGIYTYTVTGTETSTGCVTLATVDVGVIDPFNGVVPTTTASVNPVCAGSPVSLSVVIGGSSTETFENSSFPLTTYVTGSTSGTVSATQNTTYYSQGASSVLLNTTTNGADVSLSLASDINLSGLTSAQLTFSHIAAMEGPTTSYDYGYVQYSTDGGSTWTSFPTSSYAGTGTLFNGVVSFSTKSYASWISAFTGTASTPSNSLWQTETINIPSSALTSTQFRIRFRYTTDVSTLYYGWLIDDVQINQATTASSYSWSDGLTTIGTTNPLSVTPTTATTYDCTVTVSGCTATSSSTTVSVNSAPSSPSATNSTQCSSGIPAASVTSTTGATTPEFNWYVAATGGSLLQSGTSNTYTSSISATTTFYVSELLSGCESARTSVTATVAPSVGGSVTGGTTLCAGTSSTSGTLTLSGHTGSVINWESSVSPFTTWTSISNTATTYTSGSLSQTTEFRAIVQNGSCTSVASSPTTVTVNNTNTWTGATSTDWGTSTNWGCGRVPLITDDVSIVAGGNQPVIIDGSRLSNDLNIGTGATLTLNNSLSQLSIGGTYSNNGTLSHSAGEIQFVGSSNQNIPAGTYNRLIINNTSGTTLTGDVVLNDSLKLTNGLVTLGSYNLTMDGTSNIISNASSSRFVVTDGTGMVTIKNIGSTGRSGAVNFPVGSSSSSYNPVTITNTGTNDNYGVRVFNNVFNSYSGSTGSGSALTNNAVDRTWIINEALAGGSNATVTLQWTGTSELTGFARSSSYVSRYGISGWIPSTATAASGADPYTQTVSGITAFSTPFGVGSGTTLPVQLISFTGLADAKNVYLNWSTANEANNKGFEVERSLDGKSFSKIDFVKGAGTSLHIQNYANIDVRAFEKTQVDVLYYRLKQVDFNGNYTYTNTVSVNNPKVHSSSVSAYPNPFNNEFTLSLVTSQQGEAEVMIMDVQGKLIATKTITCEKGVNSYSVNELNTAYNGVYFVRVTLNGESSVVRLTKIN